MKLWLRKSARYTACWLLTCPCCRTVERYTLFQTAVRAIDIHINHWHKNGYANG